MKNMKTNMLTQGAMIAAAYVALCLVFQPISYGEVQIRIAEALTILPLFTPAAIPGLFIGCLIANVIGGGIMLDVVFGSFATLLGAVGTYYLRRYYLSGGMMWVATLPPILSNIVIVPMVLKYGYGVNLPIVFMMLTVGIGEVIGCGILGTLLGQGLKRRVMPAI